MDRDRIVVEPSRREQFLKTIQNYHRVAVAFSGGIDSTVVAQAAFDALGKAAVAVTAVSDSLAAGQEIGRSKGACTKNWHSTSSYLH